MLDDLWNDVDSAVLLAIGDAGGTGVPIAAVAESLAQKGISEEQVQRSVRFLHEQRALDGSPSMNGNYLVASLSPDMMTRRFQETVPNYDAVRRAVVIWLSGNASRHGSMVRPSYIADQMEYPLSSVNAVLYVLSHDHLLTAKGLAGPAQDMMISDVTETLRRMGEAWEAN